MEFKIGPGLATLYAAFMAFWLTTMVTGGIWRTALAVTGVVAVVFGVLWAGGALMRARARRRGLSDTQR